jgi:hypothetical protein
MYIHAITFTWEVYGGIIYDSQKLEVNQMSTKLQIGK